MREMRAEFPLPDVAWPTLEPFWRGAAENELLIPRCEGCDRFDWYPSSTCRHCGSESRRWEPVSGSATLFSWSVVRYPWISQFASLLPMITALVVLDEDSAVRLATRIVDVGPADLCVDQPMEVTFRPMSFPSSTASVTAPFFRPR